jgi:hypothetical protein
MTTPRGLCFLLSLSLFAVLVAATLRTQSLEGVTDIHIHCDPDSMPRAVDALEAARLGRQHGMRAIVLKNHHEPTAGLAWLARQQNPGIEVFGGIALNLTVGGINAAAVERMTRVKGGYGRIVWMPTFDAENAVRRSGEARAFVPVAKSGRLLPEVAQVLDLVARHKLVLATGHSSPAENLLLIREARKRGIQGILVTHPTADPIFMSAAEVKEAAGLGAFIEFTYQALIAAKPLTIADYAASISAAGVEHCILVSDLGQAGNPLPTDGFREFIRKLRDAGFSAAGIDRMAKHNPARLLSLE